MIRVVFFKGIHIFLLNLLSITNLYYSKGLVGLVAWLLQPGCGVAAAVGTGGIGPDGKDACLGLCHPETIGESIVEVNGSHLFDWCFRKKTEGRAEWPVIPCVFLLAEVVDEQVVLKDTDPLPGW